MFNRFRLLAARSPALNTNRNRFFALMWVVTLFVLRPLIPESAFADGFTSVYTLLAYGTYAAMYLAPTFIIVWLLERFTRAKKTAAAVAILGSGLTIVLLFVDARIHSLYGFHINGFVINLVLTPGGLDSLGADARTNLGIALLITVLLLVPVGLWFVSTLSFWPTVRLPRLIVFIFVALFVATLTERVMYGVGDIHSRGETLGVASSLPLHQPFTFRRFGKRIGLSIPQEQRLNVKSAGRVQYPAQPLQVVPPARPLNVIWLVTESLRADALNPEVMPATWERAQKGVRFTRHFSGGNGTRVGMFSLFSGLPGTYWFAFLNEGRGAAVIDVMLEQGYDMHLSTAQSFTYPEFGRTIFSRVPRDRMHVEKGGGGYERDGRNVARIIQTLQQRDPTKPFFVFNFFESPHAHYYFPPEAVIRPNYAKDLNYAGLDVASLKRNIESIRARYINSVHALDMVLTPLWKYLDEERLWENTIVIFTGDHGEEFMEKGRWGHNSEFVNEQVRAPLVLWVPGRPPAVDDRLSAHMDVTATVLPLLGVQNPASDYSLGYNLLEPPARTYTILADWNRAAYVDKDIKVTVPMSAAGFFRQRITDANDQPIPDASAILQAKNQQVIQVMQDISRFVRKPATAEAKK
jgi:membrane-anchored protein YejM (alkaline phosphatase superfamily)